MLERLMPGVIILEMLLLRVTMLEWLELGVFVSKMLHLVPAVLVL